MLVNAHREKSPIRPFAKARFATEKREQPGFRRRNENTVYAHARFGHDAHPFSPVGGHCRRQLRRWLSAEDSTRCVLRVFPMAASTPTQVKYSTGLARCVELDPSL